MSSVTDYLMASILVIMTAAAFVAFLYFSYRKPKPPDNTKDTPN